MSGSVRSSISSALTASVVVPPSRPERLRAHPAAAWTGTLARLVLAGVFAVAGLAKIGDPAASVRAVRAYQLLPDGLETLVGRGLPALEVALAVALLLGVALRASALIAAVLLAAFTSGIASAAARGLQIDCGCFGGGGPTENPHYTGEIVRDVAVLLAPSLSSACRPSRLALDPRRPTPVRGRHRKDRGPAVPRRRTATTPSWRGRPCASLARRAAGVLVGVRRGRASASPPPCSRDGLSSRSAATSPGGIVVGSADGAAPPSSPTRTRSARSVAVRADLAARPRQGRRRRQGERRVPDAQLPRPGERARRRRTRCGAGRGASSSSCARRCSPTSPRSTAAASPSMT